MAEQPYKVLFLHGKGETGPTFEARTEKIASALKAAGKGVEVEYLTAPIEIGENKYAWWSLPPNTRSFTATEYIGVDKTFKLIEEKWSEKGPFDAVFGHSQGAILMSVILAKALLEDYPVKPSKAVLFGAAWPKPFESLVEKLRGIDLSESQYKPKTLHVYAMNDDINPPEQAMKIKELMGSEADGHVHEGGHGIPQDEEALKKFTSFLFES